MWWVAYGGQAFLCFKEDEVAVARLKFDRLRSLALDPDESVALIQRVAAET